MLECPHSRSPSGNEWGDGGKKFYKTISTRSAKATENRKQAKQMGEDNPKTLEQLETELEHKKRLLESPFAAVGIVTNKPRGRPPKGFVPANAGDEAKANATVAHEQRMAEIVKPASDLSSEGMREWGEKELHKLIPEVVSNIKWDMKYGDSKARAEAGDKILKATGLAQKDVSNFGKGGSIVINLGGTNASSINLPFLQRNNESPTVPVIQTLEQEVKKKDGR